MSLFGLQQSLSVTAYSTWCQTLRYASLLLVRLFCFSGIFLCILVPHTGGLLGL